MSIAKISEISATSTKSFEDAIEAGIKRANDTLENVTGAWISDQKVDVADGRIERYRVNMRVTFVLND
jgi:flavin-binding protein dodecin